MCGIAGCFLFHESSSRDALRNRAARMTDSLTHRGPDDAGVWVDARGQIALGHRRLSILDLSPLGHQPMRSGCGRFTIVFNGEIYNYRDLRSELAASGCQFRGQSDTEVLVTGIAKWGVDATLERANGMFAFAVWDDQDRQLTLARDRIGIKPLYYGQAGDAFLFASELKAFRTDSAFNTDVDRNAVALLLEHSNIPAPTTIYRDACKLPPGCVLTVSSAADRKLTPRHYWSMPDAVRRGHASRFRGSEQDAFEQLHDTLADAVRLRTIADVPLGAFLSGGIDSSLVVSLLGKVATEPVRTFTIGFEIDAYNEADAARAVSQHLGTSHVEHIVTAREALDVIPLLPTLFDEPFADSSQIPTYLVSALARQHVTVALSGDGGDELFGGYERYRHIARIWKKIGWLPHGVRSRLARLAGSQRIRRWAGRSVREPGLAASVLAARHRGELYEILHRHWKQPGSVVIGANEASGFHPWNHAVRSESFIEEMMSVDASLYLPDDILTKVDRASMSVGLEARVPLLDHRVVEFAWSLPPAFRFSASVGKRPLRALLDRYVPRALVDRPKVGFGVPIDHWLRGPLRDWAESLLAERRLKAEGYFHVAAVREKWEQHLQGTHGWHYLLWDVLMFQAWLESVSTTDRRQDGAL